MYASTLINWSVKQACLDQTWAIKSNPVTAEFKGTVHLKLSLHADGDLNLFWSQRDILQSKETFFIDWLIHAVWTGWTSSTCSGTLFTLLLHAELNLDGLYANVIS